MVGVLLQLLLSLLPLNITIVVIMCRDKGVG